MHQRQGPEGNLGQQLSEDAGDRLGQQGPQEMRSAAQGRGESSGNIYIYIHTVYT